MSNRRVKLLMVCASILLLGVGAGLYLLFEYQGYSSSGVNTFVKYNKNDYIETKPIVFNNYSDVYSSINVSKVNIKNIDNDGINDFLNKEEEFIGYIDKYYSEIISNSEYSSNNKVTSSIKAQVNGTVLSIFYQIRFDFDDALFEDNVKVYFTTLNIDLGTNKILSNDDMLSKFNYSKDYIVDKIFNEDVMISDEEVVIDKNTNISLTSSDIERKKSEYVDRIINEFDNIMEMYIENNSLAIVYDKKVLNNMFFDNEFDTDIKIRYLK